VARRMHGILMISCLRCLLLWTVIATMILVMLSIVSQWRAISRAVSDELVVAPVGLGDVADALVFAVAAVVAVAVLAAVRSL
jgi:hypothetical protein